MANQNKKELKYSITTETIYQTFNSIIFNSDSNICDPIGLKEKQTNGAPKIMKETYLKEIRENINRIWKAKTNLTTKLNS